MEPSEHPNRLTVRPSKDAGLDIQLSGSFTLEDKPLSTESALRSLTENPSRIRLIDSGISEWDSCLLIFLTKIKEASEAREIQIDFTGLPAGVQRLMDLSTAIPEREGTRRTKKRDPILARIGDTAIERWEAFVNVLAFLGEATVSLGRFITRRARYRSSDLWLTIQDCGPKAFGIVTIISVLVGAILAFVGAIQLRMFGAEIYVANLVGLGMVIEMGALMTGIILAGRTGAAFAAQLGTMQVNEEIDALVTMGIPPMDYLVLPRMVALAIMTPLLVLYADILGILGGSVVGVFLLNIPAGLFFSQAFEMLSLWFCAQGLIKGSTFGIIVALCGCYHGIRCGRSASAVGDAATRAVVTSIVGIVLADAVWTFIFMTGGM